MKVKHISHTGDGNTGNTRLSTRAPSTYTAHTRQHTGTEQPPPSNSEESVLLHKKKTRTHTESQEPNTGLTTSAAGKPKRHARTKTRFRDLQTLQKGRHARSHHHTRRLDSVPFQFRISPITPGDLTHSRFNRQYPGLRQVLDTDTPNALLPKKRGLSVGGGGSCVNGQTSCSTAKQPKSQN